MLMYMGSGAALAAYRRDRRNQMLADCARACANAARACLEPPDTDGPEWSGRETLHRLAVDCEKLCSLTAALDTRQSELAAYAMTACAEACAACAAGCEQAGSHGLLDECRLKCHECEQSCRATAGLLAQHVDVAD